MNKRAIMTGIFALIALFFLGGCSLSFSGQVIRGSGKVVQENRPVTGINAVELAGTGDLILTQGDHEALTVEAEDNLLPEIDTHMDGGRLVIGLKHDYTPLTIDPTRPIRYLVTVKDVQKIVISGSGNASADSLKTTALDLVISGSGDISLGQVSADQVSAMLSGSGNIRLAGQAKNQDATISGSGNFEGGDLKGSQAKILISGSGNATLDVEDSLDVRVSGNGDVAYYGSPKLTQNVSGSGNIKSLGAR